PAPHFGRPVHPALRVVYLVTGALQGAALGLLLAASPVALDPSYGTPRAPGTLGPLEDQALGGVVMWAVGGAVDMLAVILLLYQVFTSDGDPARAPDRHPAAIDHDLVCRRVRSPRGDDRALAQRSEEHTSELQSRS